MDNLNVWERNQRSSTLLLYIVLLVLNIVRLYNELCVYKLKFVSLTVNKYKDTINEKKPITLEWLSNP